MRALVLALVMVVSLAGCAGEVGSGSSTAPPATATPDSSAPNPPAQEPPGEDTPAQGSVLEASTGVTRAEPLPDAPVAALVAGINDAGFELWRTRPAEEDLVFSPLSVGHAVLMAGAAADEPTRAAIADGFGLPSGPSAHEAWNALDLSVAASADEQEEVTVTIADRIWPRIDVAPDQDWIDLLASRHGATTEALDFAGDPDGSRDIVNEWVAEETQGLIPELIPPGFIDPRTVLILTDAIYFEARWQTVFGKYGTVDGTFTRLDGTTTPVELMRELELADRRGRGDGYVGAEIPYVGGDFSMLLLVPEEGRFEEVRDRLGQELLDEIDASFDTGPYELLVPQWEDSTNLDLLPWLTEMGAAPGSYPAISPEAFLSGAVHGADIAVDDRGTVAAAATALDFQESGPPEPELTVAADRPFLYLIRHRPTGAVLFAGQVTDPTD